MPAFTGLSATKAAAFIFSILALVSTWILVFKFYREHRKDLLRVKLSSLRDQIRDFAMEQKWSLTDPDVKTTLEYAGAAIRAASGMTLTRYLLFQAAARFSAALRLVPQTHSPSKLAPFREEIDCAIAEHIAVFPLNWALRKLNRTWPSKGTIVTLVRTAAFSVILTHEPRH